MNSLPLISHHLFVSAVEAERRDEQPQSFSAGMERPPAGKHLSSVEAPAEVTPLDQFGSLAAGEGRSPC